MSRSALPMDADTRHRALTGALGADAQRLALDEITTTIPASPSLLTGRQKFVAILVTALFVGAIIALAAMRLALPARLARRAAGL